MTTEIRFYGVAAYEIITSGGQHIWIDPFLDDNPGSPLSAADVEHVDLILVTHGAFDHLGDAGKLAQRTGAPVVCGGEVKALLVTQGIPEQQLQATTWGIAVEVAGIRVQPVICQHWSQVRMPDGTLASGVPMGFVVSVDPGVRFYHYGDTAIFSDLKLIGELYKPTVGCIGITQPQELLQRISGPGRIVSGEMNPREGALAAQWLGLQTVLPCHYINADCQEVRDFQMYLEEAHSRGVTVPEVVVLQPGEALYVE